MAIMPNHLLDHFLDRPGYLQALQTALLTVAFFIPFSAGSINHLVYFYSFLMVFFLAVILAPKCRGKLFKARFRHKHKALFILIIAWLLLATISLVRVISLDSTPLVQIAAACLRHLLDILLLLYTLTLGYLYLNSSLTPTRLFAIFTAGLIGLIIFYILLYNLGPEPVSIIWSLQPPLGVHVRDLGNMAAASSVFLGIYLLASRSPRQQYSWLASIALACTFAFLIWLGGRAGFITTLFTLITFIIFSLVLKKLSIKRLGVLVITLFIGFFLADAFTVWPWNGFNRFYQKATEAIVVVENKKTSDLKPGIKQTDIKEKKVKILNDKFTSNRLTVWSISINAFKQSPWLGLGPYGYFFIPERTYDDQPHNFIIQFLVSWGILGASLMLLILLYCAWIGLKTLPSRIVNHDVDYLISAGVVLTLTLHGLTGGTFFKLQALFCLLSAFAWFPFGPAQKSES